MCFVLVSMKMEAEYEQSFFADLLCIQKIGRSLDWHSLSGMVILDESEQDTTETGPQIGRILAVAVAPPPCVMPARPFWPEPDTSA